MGFIGRPIGFIIGAFVGWSISAYILSKVSIDICLYKVLFACVVGPELIGAVLFGYIVSNIVGKIVPI